MRGRLLVARVGAFVTSAVGRAKPSGGAVLAYHDVTPEAEGPHHVTPTQFATQLRVALDRGWTFVSTTEIVDRLLRGERVDGLAAITFDDAWKGLPDHAIPHLVENGMPATIFVITDRHDPTKYMVESQVKDAITAGLTIASHTRTHASLPELDDGALTNELRGSREILGDRFGVDTDLLAYPRGHFDERVCAAATTAGYRAAFTYANGKVSTHADLMRLPRLTMGPHHTARRLAYHLARGPAAWPDPLPHASQELAGSAANPVEHEAVGGRRVQPGCAVADDGRDAGDGRGGAAP